MLARGPLGFGEIFVLDERARDAVSGRDGSTPSPPSKEAGLGVGNYRRFLDFAFLVFRWL